MSSWSAAPLAGRSSRRCATVTSTGSTITIWWAIWESWASRTVWTCWCAPSACWRARATIFCCTWPGDGESYGEIEALVNKLGLRENVVMAGFQTKEEFTAALRDADVCVAPDPPSPFNDISTMNKIVEYMALGRPCVAFGLPENKITGADAAVYADEPTFQSLARAIGRLLDDEQERTRLGDQARERFERVLA